MDYRGLITCTRYAFPPNSLKYCGPDKVLDLYGYFLEKPDQGLVNIIKDFQVLYLYLKLIAFENNIADPFDRQVVEAYWLGNNLLDKISLKSFYYHLLDEQQLKKKVSPKDLKWLVGKLPQGATPHHSFHVFNIFKRTGHQIIEHTLETMDACRIGWGKAIEVKNEKLKMKSYSLKLKIKENLEIVTKPLVLRDGRLHLGKPILRKIKTEYKNRQVSQLPKIGDWVSFHWDFFCDILTPRQVVNLEKYTQISLDLTNQTL